MEGERRKKLLRFATDARILRSFHDMNSKEKRIEGAAIIDHIYATSWLACHR